MSADRTGSTCQERNCAMADGVAVEVLGIAALANKLDYLERKSRVAIARSAIRGGMNVVAKQMKKDLDPRVKEAGKAIKGRFKSGKKLLILSAKVGFVVGRRNKKQRSTIERPKGRPGVGISGNNVHWWVAGTKHRTTKRGASRGVMPAMQPGLARKAFLKSRGRMAAEMRKRFDKQLAKEVAKLQSIK